MRGPAAEIQAYYDSVADERSRLLRGTSRLEFQRTKEIIRRYLPSKPSVILDIGGGPGHYTLWLASMGHRVHLVDANPNHVQQAKEILTRHSVRSRSRCTVSLGNATRLDFKNASADGVLLLGPLYHLTRRADRLRALSEAFRVMKPNGVIFAGAVSRFTSLLDGMFHDRFKDPVFVKIVERDLKDGQHRNPTRHPEYFTTAFFHRVEELDGEVRQAGFRPTKMFAVDGFGEILPHFEKMWAEPKQRLLLLKMLRKVEAEPSIIGMSPHLLCVGWKRRVKD